MSIDIEVLQKQALKTVSVNNYYELADTIDELSAYELEQIIACNGDHKLEDKVIADNQFRISLGKDDIEMRAWNLANDECNSLGDEQFIKTYRTICSI